MSLYSVALFAHIVGVVGVFIGIAFDWMTILRLRRAQTTAVVREATSLVRLQARLVQVCALLLLIAGIYMTVTAWGWDRPWIRASLLGLVVMGALSGGVTSRRLAVIRKAAAEAGDSGVVIPSALQHRLGDPVVLISVQTAGLLGLGVVFLMTVKPDVLGSLVTLAVSVILGVLSAQPWRRPREARALVKEAQLGS